MERILQDLRFAVRTLVRTPGTTVAATISLALGIGANAAIFSAVDTFLLRPLPFPESERLFVTWLTRPERGAQYVTASVPDFQDLRAELGGMELVAWSGVGTNVAGLERPLRLRGLRASHDLLALLGATPDPGRGFRPDDESPGAGRTVILGHHVWVRDFGSDPSVLGRTLSLDGTPHEVVGVAPADLHFYGRQDLWLPLEVSATAPRDARFLTMMVRLADGVSPTVAEGIVAATAERLAATFPDTNEGMSARLNHLRSEWFDEGFRQGSLIAGLAVMFVLLIACANVANLMLARGARREREMALRGALGARRSRIVAQLGVESLVLAGVGGVLGLAVALMGIRGIQGLFPPFLPGDVSRIELSPRVLLFTVGVTVLAGVLFGLAPTLQTLRTDLRGALTEGKASGLGFRAGKARTVLVMGEVALAVVLLVSASLLVRSFNELRQVELGFRTEGVVTLRTTLAESRYPDDPSLLTFQRLLLQQLEESGDFTAVGAAASLPMQGLPSRSYRVVGEPPPDPGREPTTRVRHVTPGYFEALEIDLRAGRLFERLDDPVSPQVTVVNERFAARHWPGRNPVGERIELGGVLTEIVGVVEDTRDFGPDDDPPVLVYLSALQQPVRGWTLAVRAAGEPASAAESIRRVVGAMDPEQPVYDLQTMEQILADEISGHLAMAKVLGVLAAVAFILAVVGVYGVLSYNVVQRTREMGIRLALGADRSSVLALVIRQGMTVAGIGIAGGVLLALWGTRLLTFFLFGVSPLDPLAFGAVVGTLALAALAASTIPAVRATRVDPLDALRTD